MAAPRPRQSWQAGRYARTARFVSDLGAPLVDLLDPRPGERVLDLGCGDGVLAAEIAARGARVLALDASPDMVAAARARGVDARLGDGEALGFGGGFDAVFSNAALHWMRRPEAVVDGIWRALDPGGRFVAEFGGAGNIAAVAEALDAALSRHGVDVAAIWPWYFPTEDAYRALLEARGFRVERIGLHPRPTPLPGPVEDWLDTFAESFLAALPEAERPALKAEVARALRPRLLDADGCWVLDYVRLRLRAWRPEDRK